MIGWLMTHRNSHGKYSVLFYLFCIWAFILICRPQDYILYLDKLRIGLTLGLIIWISYCVLPKKSEKIAYDGQFRLYSYLLIVMVLSVPFSTYISASLREVINYAGITMIFFFLFYQLVNTVDKLERILFALCSGVAIYAVNILKDGDYSSGRLYFGSTFDPNDIAYFIISFLTLNLFFLNRKHSCYVRAIFAVNIIIGVIVILKTGSRSGFIGCAAMFTYLILTKTTSINISIVFKSLFVSVVILSLQYVPMDTKRVQTIFDVQNDYNITDEYGRLTIWKTGIRMMISRPLTGVGMSCFNEQIGRDRESRGVESARWQTAHNSLVQIGAEIGVFGLIIFCLMSINVFRITGKVIGQSQSESLVKISELARAGFIGHFICAMFLSQAYSIYWIFYIVLSAVLNNLLSKEAEIVEIVA